MRVLHVVTGLTAAIAVLALNAPTGAFEPTSQGAWLTDFAQAKKLAAQQGRPILVHFHAHYCPPCRQMERESLNSPEVLSMIRESFIAVKVDVERYSDIAEQYDVSSWPTDMILAPNGGVITKTVGYVSKPQYLGSVARIEARYAESRRAMKPQSPPPAVAARPQETLPPYPTDDPSATDTNRGNNTLPKVALQNPAQPTEPALDGYCAVTLRNTRSWKKGSAEHSLDHQGQTYYFLSATELSAFKANPARFAPRNLGCDPVVLSENDLAAPGTTKFGAYFDGELYLFKSADTRTRFRNDPLRYSRARHVLKPEELQKRRL